MAFNSSSCNTRTIIKTKTKYKLYKQNVDCEPLPCNTRSMVENQYGEEDYYKNYDCVIEPVTDISITDLQIIGNNYLSSINSKLFLSSNPIINSLSINIAYNKIINIYFPSLNIFSNASSYSLQTSTNLLLTNITNKLPSSIGSKTITNSVAVNIASDQSIPISILSVNLPTGASTAALQTTGNNLLTTISNQLPSSLGAKNISQSLAINFASDQIFNIANPTISLPSGASTSALQTSGNTLLTGISNKIPSTIGSKNIANSLAINIASNQTVPLSISSLPLPSGASTSSLDTTKNTLLSSITNQLPLSLGSKTIANSLSINIASNQTIPISLAPLSRPTGWSASSLQTNGNNLLTAISGKFPTTLGSKTITNSMPVNIASDQNMKIINNTNELFDGFYRFRTSEPLTISSSKFLVDNNSTYWTESSTGSGTSSTYNTDKSSITLNVSNLTAGNILRQQQSWSNYQTNKSQLIYITFNMNGLGGTGITKSIGYFNDDNGIILNSSSNVLNLFFRTSTSGSAVDTIVSQANWNVDSFDGTGPSGITLDMTKTQILIIDFQWSGRVRCGFVINGIIYYAHYYYNSNINSLVFMSNTNLPIRYQLINSGSGALSTLTCICCSVITEGGNPYSVYTRGIDRGSNPVVVLASDDSNVYSLISIRLKTTTRMASVKLLSYNIYCDATTFYYVRVILNASGSYFFNSFANSLVDIDNSSNTIITGGTVLYTAYINNNSSGIFNSNTSTISLESCNIILGSTLTGGVYTNNIITLAIGHIDTGVEKNYYGSLNISEII